MLLRTKDESADLDALTADGVGARAGVDEGAVGNPASDSGAGLEGFTVETLEQDPLAGSHAAEVVPALGGVVADGGRLADVVGVAVLDGDDVVVAQGGGGGEGEGQGLDGVGVEGPPDVDEAVAAAEQVVGLVGEVAADAADDGGGRLVDVDAGDGGAVGGGAGAADGVVEDVDAAGAGDAVEQQALDLGLVVGADGGVAVEGEAGAGGGGLGAQVADERVVRVVDEVALRPAVGRRVVVEGGDDVTAGRLGRRHGGGREGFGGGRWGVGREGGMEIFGGAEVCEGGLRGL